MPRLQDLRRSIDGALRDNRVTAEEARSWVQQAPRTNDGERDLAREAKDMINAASLRHGVVFDPGAREALLTIGVQPLSAEALEAMRRELDAAAPGGITAAELKAAESKVARAYGAATATDVLLASIGVRARDLAMDAMGFLESKCGDVSSHLDRLQAVVDSHKRGARLLDLNQNGQPDSQDLIYSKSDDGQVSIEAIDLALRDRVKVAQAVVSACFDMARAQHAFIHVTPTGWTGKFSPEFWTGGPHNFTVKEGVKPSDAIQDLFNHPSAYEFECGTAMAIVYHKAILDLLGPEDFNRLCTRLTLGPEFSYGTGMAPDYQETGSTRGRAENSPLLAGDRGFIRNWDVSPEQRKKGWVGENVVYLGKLGGQDLYYGHPFGIETADKIIEYLNENRNAGSTISASHSDLRGVLRNRILNQDHSIG